MSEYETKNNEVIEVESAFDDKKAEVEEEEENHVKTLKTRDLTHDELDKLNNDKIIIAEFKKIKIENETAKNWDKFYNRNKTNFFKNRYWTLREFEELDESFSKHNNDDAKSLLEIGCGVGNFIFPLLNLNKNLLIYPCDFSSKAIDLLKINEDYLKNTDRCFPFQCDIVKDNLLEKLENKQMDIVTLIFVLSAIHPKNFNKAIQNIYKILKPGGIVLFRDYGMYDHAQLRFQPGQKLEDKCYHRCDHTLTYFFELNEIESLFQSNGFETKTNVFVLRETKNVKESLKISRVFIQSKFIKQTNTNKK